ncbi:MAG: hypothetical protein HOP03_06385 [Lysobacter sp.]|nr:hypothetical protein [Lysobacter sp.]
MDNAVNVRSRVALSAQLYGILIKCRDGEERRLILLCNDQDNGPGGFDLIDGTPVKFWSIH